MRWPWPLFFANSKVKLNRLVVGGDRLTVSVVASLFSSTTGVSDNPPGMSDNPPGMSDDRDIQIIQFNHAGASPSPPSVVERVQQHLKLEQEIGGYDAAEAVASEIHDIYQDIARLIGAGHASDIALVESATVAWTRMFYSMVEKQRKEDLGRDIIVISDAEYAANVVAACQWARSNKWMVLSIPSSVVEGTSSGVCDLDVAKKIFEGKYEFIDPLSGSRTLLDPARIAVVCITHVPTNSGIVNPVEEIGELIKIYNEQQNAVNKVYYLVDSCQSIGQMDVDVRHIHCDALVATGRKYLRGPRGSGFLYVANETLKSLMPSHVDHFGVPIQSVPTEYVDGAAIQDLINFAPRSDARRFEFWESSAASRLGLGMAIKYASQISLARIQEEIKELSAYLRQRLSSIPSVQIHHRNHSTCGIVTFSSTVKDSVDIKAALKDKSFALSIVPATSTPLDSSRTNLRDFQLVRSSVSYTNTPEEIDRFVECLSLVLKSS